MVRPGGVHAARGRHVRQRAAQCASRTRPSRGGLLDLQESTSGEDDAAVPSGNLQPVQPRKLPAAEQSDSVQLGRDAGSRLGPHHRVGDAGATGPARVEVPVLRDWGRPEGRPLLLDYFFSKATFPPTTVITGSSFSISLSGTVM